MNVKCFLSECLKSPVFSLGNNFMNTGEQQNELNVLISYFQWWWLMMLTVHIKGNLYLFSLKTSLSFFFFFLLNFFFKMLLRTIFLMPSENTLLLWWTTPSFILRTSVQPFLVLVLLLFSRSAVSNSLQSYGLQHTRLPHPSLSPAVCSNLCPWSWWCHPTISSSVAPFSSCPQPFPASGFSPMSQLFTSGGQSTGTSASASALPINIQGWFPLGLTVLISFRPRGSQESSPAPQFKSVNSSVLSLLSGPLSHLYMTTGKTIALTICYIYGPGIYPNYSCLAYCYVCMELVLWPSLTSSLSWDQRISCDHFLWRNIAPFALLGMWSNKECSWGFSSIKKIEI